MCARVCVGLFASGRFFASAAGDCTRLVMCMCARVDFEGATRAGRPRVQRGVGVFFWLVKHGADGFMENQYGGMVLSVISCRARGGW